MFKEQLKLGLLGFKLEEIITSQSPGLNTKTNSKYSEKKTEKFESNIDYQR